MLLDKIIFTNIKVRAQRVTISVQSNSQNYGCHDLSFY